MPCKEYRATSTGDSQFTERLSIQTLSIPLSIPKWGPISENQTAYCNGLTECMLKKCKNMTET